MLLGCDINDPGVRELHVRPPRPTLTFSDHLLRDHVMAENLVYHPDNRLAVGIRVPLDRQNGVICVAGVNSQLNRPPDPLLITVIMVKITDKPEVSHVSLGGKLLKNKRGGWYGHPHIAFKEPFFGVFRAKRKDLGVFRTAGVGHHVRFCGQTVRAAHRVLDLPLVKDLCVPRAFLLFKGADQPEPAVASTAHPPHHLTERLFCDKRRLTDHAAVQ